VSVAGARLVDLFGMIEHVRADLQALPRPLAFVFPGGGALGAYQVGVLAALTDAGVRADMLIGVSAGAVNASLFAWNQGADGLRRMEQIWRSLRRRDLLRLHPGRMVMALSGRRPSMIDNRYGKRWLERYLGVRRIEDSPIGLAIVATDLESGRAKAFTSGEVVSAALASSAFPGAYPPVERDGRWYIDGGVVADIPLDIAVDLGAKGALIIQVPSHPEGPSPRGAIEILLRASTFGVEAHGRTVLARPPEGLTVIEIPAAASTVTTFAIGNAGAIIDEARSQTSAWLRSTPAP